MSGAAELTYTDFDLKADSPLAGNDLRFSGHSFAQRYSLAWKATNMYNRAQPQFYTVSLGYDWLSYSTEYDGTTTKGSIDENYGKFSYSGEIGYNPRNLPLKLYVYATDSSHLSFETNIRSSSNENALIGDGLYKGISGKLQDESRGFSFEFDPDSARSIAFRGLPRLNIDYRERFIKSDSADFNRIDVVFKELAVAGLVKGNNWITYRNLDYQDRVDGNSSSNQQQLQIGHVDYSGKRLWSALTNWIDVSADGLLTNRKGSLGDFEEIYDLNFFARANRRTWNAITLMSFTRELSRETDGYAHELEEHVRLPVYVKGIYGSETDWYTNVTLNRGTQNRSTPTGSKANSYENVITVGGTTFSRSAFTLSPMLSVMTSKVFEGSDSLNLKAALETNSTARYSRKVGLAARSELNYLDDGSGSINSKTWNGIVKLKADYLASTKITASFAQTLEAGEKTVLQESDNGLKPYVHSLTALTAAWTPNAVFSTSLQAAYDWRQHKTTPVASDAYLLHRLTYSKNYMTLNFDSKYQERKQDGNRTREFIHTGNVSYRPDRHNDASVAYGYTAREYGSVIYSYLEIIERYSYNFFTRTGEARNLATMTQEIGYQSNENGIGRIDQSRDTKTSKRWLLFSGRYSPLAKLSLYGSIRYEKEDPGSVAMFYGAGMNADFKLLSTSLDYIYAKRDSDNRVEKKLSAAVRRSF